MAPATADASDGAGVDEARERLAKAFVADAESSAQVGAGARSHGESGEHGLLEAAAVCLGGGRVWTVLGRGDEIATDVLVASELDSERFGVRARRDARPTRASTLARSDPPLLASTRRMSGWLMNARKSSGLTVVRFTRARYSARLVGAATSLAASRASRGGW